MSATAANSWFSSAAEPNAPIDGRSRRDKPQKWGNPFTYFAALLFIGVCIAPVLYIVVGGFRTNSQITTSPAALPKPWVTANYVDVLQSTTFWGEFANSLIVALASTVGILVLGLMVSFVLARYDFKLKGAMYSLFAAGLMFPMVIAITPLYIVIKDLGLVDNLLGVIVPQIAFGLPTTVIILVPFLRAIPNEIEEAAAIDGASRLGFFVRMVIPLSLPGVVTVGSPRVHRQLEQLRPAAVHPQLASQLHTSARSPGVLLAVLHGHGEGPRVHVARDAARTRLLLDLRETDRRRSHRRRQGLKPLQDTQPLCACPCPTPAGAGR